MITLVYKYKWRSTEEGNWQTERTVVKEVTNEKFEELKANCGIYGMRYSERYNEFWMVNLDRLHALSITVKKGI